MLKPLHFCNYLNYLFSDGRHYFAGDIEKSAIGKLLGNQRLYQTLPHSLR